MAHKEIDLKNPKTNRKNAGFTDEERAKFSALLDAGFIDTYRYFIRIKKEFTPGGPTGLRQEKRMQVGVSITSVHQKHWKAGWQMRRF